MTERGDEASPEPRLPPPSSPNTPGSTGRPPIETPPQAVGLPAHEFAPDPKSTAVQAAAGRERMAATRRRNRAVGWIAGLAAAVTVGALIFVGYRIYRDDQEIRLAELDSAGAPATIGPGEMIDVLEQRGEAPAPTVDPLLAGRSPDVSSEVDGPGFDVNPVSTAPPPEPVQREPVQTSSYHLRLFSSFEATSTPGLSVLFDATNDTYQVREFESGAETPMRYIDVGSSWRTEYPSGGPMERRRRSVASLAPEPDLPIRGYQGEADVLPTNARPFSREIPVTTGVPESWIERDLVRSYVFDMVAFRAADPAGAAAWIDHWNWIDLDDPALVEPAPVETKPLSDRLASMVTGPPLFEFDPMALNPPAGTAIVFWAAAENGQVIEAVIASPDDDLRVQFRDSNGFDGPLVSLVEADEGWLPG